MMVKIVTHSTELTATRWTPTGGKVGHDIIPTNAEMLAVNRAVKMMLGHALSQIGDTPVWRVLTILRRAAA